MRGNIMEDKLKAKIIVDVIKRKVEEAAIKHINAKAEEARVKVGHEFWEKEQGDYIGFSTNPYNIDRAIKSVAEALEEKLARQEVLNYAIDVFLDKIE